MVTDEDIGLKILYEAPSDAQDADPASPVEYESITPKLCSVGDSPTLVSWQSTASARILMTRGARRSMPAAPRNVMSTGCEMGTCCPPWCQRPGS